MSEHDADQLVSYLMLTSQGKDMFEVSLGDATEYKMVATAFKRVGIRTGPDGEFFILRVYPKG